MRWKLFPALISALSPAHDMHAGEDLWHTYNIIRQGDLVTATTFRKVSRDSGAGTQSEKIRIKLTVQVESVEYDAEGKPFTVQP